MKKTLKIFGVLCLAVFTFASCSKDDDPKDNNLFVGTYKGDVSYTNEKDSSKSVKETEGSVTVTKVGDNYTFAFSDGIPPIADVKIEKGENKFEVTGWLEGSIITIDESSLKIIMRKDKQSWTANAKR